MLLSHSSFNLVKFNEDASQVIAVTNKEGALSTWVGIFSTTAGSLTYKFDFMNGASPAALYVTDAVLLGSSVFFSMATLGSSFHIEKYTISAGVVSLDWEYTLSE